MVKALQISTFNKMKKEIAARLAHKAPFKRIESEPDKQIDLLIVVDQMLTGFDSKWLILYIWIKYYAMKILFKHFQELIDFLAQIKPFGTIR